MIDEQCIAEHDDGIGQLQFAVLKRRELVSRQGEFLEEQKAAKLSRDEGFDIEPLVGRVRLSSWARDFGVPGRSWIHGEQTPQTQSENRYEMAEPEGEDGQNLKV